MLGYKTGRPTVFVIDDDKNIRWSLTILLQDKYNVIRAKDIEEVKEMVYVPFDIVILDNLIDGKNDGYEIYQYLVSQNKKVPTVMLSAFIDDNLKNKFKSTAVKEFIDKSMHSNKYLLEVIEKLITKIPIPA